VPLFVLFTQLAITRVVTGQGVGTIIAQDRFNFEALCDIIILFFIRVVTGQAA